MPKICSYVGTTRPKFWLHRQTVYPTLTPMVLELLSAPELSAYIERIISLFVNS